MAKHTAAATLEIYRRTVRTAAKSAPLVMATARK